MDKSLKIIIAVTILGVIGLLAFALTFKGDSKKWPVLYAEYLGLDIEKFKTDLESDAIKARVEADIAEGESRGVNSTPTFFVNGQRMVFTSNPLTELYAAIDSAYAETNTKVSVEEFSDFECPACGSYFPIVELMKIEYADKIDFTYKHFPLTSIHPFAYEAALGAEAAREQGVFDEYHDLLFLNQADLPHPDFSSLATPTATVLPTEVLVATVEPTIQQ